MADESHAIRDARNHATSTGRRVVLAFESDGEVHAGVGDATGLLGESYDSDAAKALRQAIDAADTYVHRRENAKPKPAGGIPAEVLAIARDLGETQVHRLEIDGNGALTVTESVTLEGNQDAPNGSEGAE